MGFIERGKTESLAEHLLKNADALGVSADQESRLRLAFRLAQGTNTQKAEAGVIAVAVRNELDASLKALLAGVQDRGEKVSTFNDAGARRIKGRDGVALLHERKALTNLQAKTALAFRLVYEACGAGVGSCLGRAGEGRSVPNWGDMPIYINDEGEAALAKGAIDLHRAFLLVRLNKMERAAGSVLETGRELHALRMVAGEGRTIREVAGSSGHAREETVKALQRALDAISKALRITGH